MNRIEPFAIFLVWWFGSVVLSWTLGTIVDYIKKNRPDWHKQSKRRKRKYFN